MRLVPFLLVTEDLRSLLRSCLTEAMKERDLVAVRALRSTLAAIDNAEAPQALAVPGLAIERSPRGIGATEITRLTLTDDDVRALVQSEIDERLEAAAGYAQAGQPQRSENLRIEAAVLAVVMESLGV